MGRQGPTPLAWGANGPVSSGCPLRRGCSGGGGGAVEGHGGQRGALSLGFLKLIQGACVAPAALKIGSKERIQNMVKKTFF